MTCYLPLVYRVPAFEARPYFDHPSQRNGGMVNPAELHDNGIEYWVCGGVCGAFHRAQWPGVWMAHHGVKPDAWGHATGPAKAILEAFWRERQPDLVIGWTKASNRAALAFARRLGFIENGRMALPGGAVVMQEWRL